QEFDAVAGYRPRFVVDVEERDLPAELGVERIARAHRPGRRFDLGDDVHGGFWARVAEHPLDIAGCGKPSRPSGYVAYFQHRKFDRRIERDIHPQLRGDAVL